MRVYRITASQYAKDPLNGVGAALVGGRWNSKGTRMGYASQSRSLALLELLVHVDRRCLPANRIIVAIEIRDELIEQLEHKPSGWNRFPYSQAVQTAGDKWIRSGTSLALRVPSAIVRDEWNLLVNPNHPHARQIRVNPAEPIALDTRLFAP